MTRYTFGEATDEGDVLEIQGQTYEMQSIGMRAMKRMLVLRKKMQERQKDAAPGEQMSEESLNTAIELVLGAVKPHERDRLADHIEESVGPALLSQIASAVIRSMSDVDPTQPESSSDGSPAAAAGSPSTGGALPAPSIPST